MKKVIAICLTACMVMTGCGGSKSGAGEPRETVAGSDGQNVKTKDEVIFCQGNGLTILDITIGQQERAHPISNNVFNPLFTHDSDMKMQPCLTTEHEWVDDTTLKLTLKEGVKFYDGSDMNAEDVKFTLDPTSQRRALLVENYDGCTIDDDYHVTAKLKTPNLAFSNILTLPQASVVPTEYDEAVFGASPTDTGPHKLEEAAEDDYYILERFDGYQGDPAKTKLLTMKIVSEASQCTTILETGEVGVAYEVPSNNIPRIQGNKDLQVLTNPSMKITLMELNCSSDGPVGNPDIRRTVECVINKQTIVNSSLYGFGMASNNTILQSIQDYGKYEADGYDPKKAKSLLTQAGYNDGTQLTLQISSNQANAEIAQALQSQLVEMGTNFNIVTQDDNTSFSLIEASEDFDLMLDSWQTNIGYVDCVFDGMLPPTSANNFSQCYGPKFDEIYVRHASTGEGEEGEVFLKQSYNDMVMGTPAIGLYNETEVVAAASEFQGLMLSQIGAYEYRNTVVTED